MMIHPGFAGIDISKHTLELFDASGGGKLERLDNTPATAAALARRFKLSGIFPLFEATGRYDRALRDAFVTEELAFARVNPARARDFAKAIGKLAKTDAIDARMLAAMAQSLSPQAFAPRHPQRQNLADLQLRRDQLVAMRAEEANHLEGLSAQPIIDQIQRHMVMLDGDIANLEADIQAVFETSPELARANLSLRSIPGIGPVAATVLIALLPELGRCSSKAIAALAGLAPFNTDSGAQRGKRKIKGGRPRVRRALYMAAIATIRTQSRFSATYKRLTASGKPAKVALIAVARKILITANAILRDRKSYAS
jgi:transposase